MFCAIILAAGYGTRMNNTKKQFCKLGNKLIIEYSVEAFLKAGANEIIVSTNKENLDQVKNLFYKNNKIKIVAGGKTRQQSALNAFLTCDKNNKLVLIHDAARPFIEPESIKKLVEVATKTKAATLANFATDTVKLVTNKKVKTTLNREQIALIQTPQAFDLKIYEKALSLAAKEPNNFTDDCQLVEQLNIPITVVENSKLNFKITTPIDMEFAKFLVNNQKTLNNSTD